MRRISIALVGGALASAALAIPAAASDFVFGPLTRVSPTESPYGATASGPACAPGQSGTNYPGAEVEPWVSFVGDFGVASWQQDRWSNGGSNGLPVAVTHDGGHTWTMPANQPGFTCAATGTPPDSTTPAGVVFERASDPWTAISADGSTAYAMALDLDGTDAVNGMAVSRSTDGGTSWSTPVMLKKDTSATVLNDKNSMTADRFDADTAYAIWDRLEFPNEHASVAAAENAVGFRGPVWFSKTGDFGASWSTARMIYDPGRINQTIGNQIVVLGDGTLVDGFNLIYNVRNRSQRGNNVATLTSTDQGDHWSSKATLVSPLRSIGVPNVRSGDSIPEIAADPRANSTTFYLVWQDAAPSGGAYDEVVMKKCDGAGGHVSCGPTQLVNEDTGHPAFTPSVRVRGDGTLAVTYYQFTGSSSEPFQTKTIAFHQHPDGTQSRQEIPSGTFDMAQAAVARGYFVGDYEGLGEDGDALLPFFVGTDGAQKSSACSDRASETETAGTGDCALTG